MHGASSFITLTYSDDFLPPGRTLVKKHFQDFMKRLRKSLGKDELIRYYHCGEYGDQYGRPHYHALIFGHAFPDKVLWKTVRGVNCYTSEKLDALWGKGFTSIGDVTFQSAAYVARYVLKKQTGSQAKRWYQFVDPDTGEIHDRLPEYTTMSLRPGIGATWFDKFGSDVYPDDFVVLKGKKMAAPRFYDALFERQHGETALEAIKRKRIKACQLHLANNTPERLKVREEIQKVKANLLKRDTIK